MENKLEAQNFDDNAAEHDTSKNTLSIRNIVIGSVALVLIVGAALTFVYRASLFKSSNGPIKETDKPIIPPVTPPVTPPVKPVVESKDASFTFNLKFSIPEKNKAVFDSLKIESNSSEERNSRIFYSVPITSKAQYLETRAKLSKLKGSINFETPNLIKKQANGKIKIDLICADPSAEKTMEFEKHSGLFEFVNNGGKPGCQIDYDSLIEKTFKKTIHFELSGKDRKSVSIKDFTKINGATNASYAPSHGKGQMTFDSKVDLFKALTKVNSSSYPKDISEQIAKASLHLEDGKYQIFLKKNGADPIVKSFKTVTEITSFTSKLHSDHSLEGYSIDYEATVIDSL
jgi:flagellar basal body-associated protein FliL